MRTPDLSELLEAKEGEHVEFKEAKNRFDFEELVKYACAIANEGGGYIVLSVTDNRPRQVVGSEAFDQPERTRAGLMERLHLRIDFHLLHHDGKRVLVFDIPSRPVGMAVQYENIHWERHADSLRGMSTARLREIFAEAGHDFSADICKDANLGDLGTIDHASSTDESVNGLTRVAQKYSGREVSMAAEPGDVVFFAGHILHRSHTNHSNRPRRAYVGHYCNARAWVPWNAGDAYEGDAANHLHILARGTTHLPYAQPKFGTACAANQPEMRGINPAQPPMSMMADAAGMMAPAMHAEKEDDE